MRDDPRAARARELFQDTFHAQAEGVAVAPGRVNLIGEHTDYNLGYVLPMAIDRGVAIAFRARDDRTVRARSTLTGDTQSIDLDTLTTGHRGWMAYVAGVAWALAEAGNEVRGADLLIHSDLPTGAGLSSSAALEVAAVLALGRPGRATPCETIATVARRAENAYVGVACGVMDQMASSCSREGEALFLDCRSLSTDGVILPDDLAIVVIDTGARRKLAESEYNDRRAACERAVAILQPLYPGVRSLRDVKPDDVIAARAHLRADDYNRALHVVTENQRVLGAVDALLKEDLNAFGALLDESHASLRDWYEVSSAELNSAVECAREHAACYGARLTGAGFGGCAIAAVNATDVAAFVDELRPELHRRIGAAADAFVCKPAEGAFAAWISAGRDAQKHS